MTRTRMTSFVLAILASLSSTTQSSACTTMSFGNEGESLLYARNYDFPSGEGYVMVNRKNMLKKALLPTAGPTPANWTSKYGSVTFNQFGRELPLGGMNEAGLVVEVMVLESSNFGTYKEGEKALNEAQWIQYELDNFSTVADLIEGQKDLRIVPFAMKLHYLACDTTKQCATLEFLDGALKVHTKTELNDGDKRIAVLANSTYKDSRDYLKTIIGFGGTQPVPTGPGSLSRFARAARWVSAQKLTMDPIDKAFMALHDVAQPNFTKWHIVYDQTQRRIAFQPAGFPGRKWIYFADLDFSCKQPVTAIDVNGDQVGNLKNYWQPLTRDDNIALLRKTVGTLPVAFPDPVVVQVASYPFVGTQCQE